MSNLALETILRELKKIAELFLNHEGPLNKIINACDRFVALQGLARLDRIKQELNEALQKIHEYAETIKRLIADAGKYLD